MKPLATIDFAARRPAPRLGALLLLGAAASVAWPLWSGWQLQQETARIAAATPAPKAVTRRSSAPSDAQRRMLAQAQAISAQIDAPWFELLAAFEQHSHAGIGLLRLEPDARQMRIRVQAQARDEAAMLDYLIALEADPRLADVLLVSHQVEAEAPGKPIRFMIKAGWRRPEATARIPGGAS